MSIQVIVNHLMEKWSGEIISPENLNLMTNEAQVFAIANGMSEKINYIRPCAKREGIVIINYFLDGMLKDHSFSIEDGSEEPIRTKTFEDLLGFPSPDLSVMQEMADLAESMKGIKPETILDSDKVREAGYKLRYALGKVRGLSASETIEAIDAYIDAKIERAFEIQAINKSH